MKIYKTQEQIERDVKNGMLIVDDDVEFEVSFKIDASLKINGSILAWNITAWNITARNISAVDISAWDISVGGITARDIAFNAVCYAYRTFKCKSIKGTRKNSKYFCLDSDVKITG